jgi:hypothetical protein
MAHDPIGLTGLKLSLCSEARDARTDSRHVQDLCFPDYSISTTRRRGSDRSYSIFDMTSTSSAWRRVPVFAKMLLS